MIRIAQTIALAAGLAFPGSAEAEGSDPIAAILAEAQEFCASFEDGTFEPGDAVQTVDLDGAPPLDTVIDTAEFACTSMATAYCGTGGCTLWTIVNGETAEFQAEGWRRIDWDGRPILLVARDGGWCGGAGAQLCFEAVSWSAGQMLTVMPPLE